MQQAADTLGVREVAARVDEDDVGRRRLDQRGGVGGQHADGVQQQAEGGQNLRRRLKDAGHQQQLAHVMPPPGGVRRLTTLYKHKRDPGATPPEVPLR